jgi:hypothetical protein
MRTSTKLIRLCAVVPAGVAGSFVAMMGMGFLPGAGLVLAFLGTVLVSIVLARGWGEAAAARIFGFAHGPRPWQRAALELTLRLTEKVGLGPTRVLVRLTDGDGPPASPIGRDTVIVEPWLVVALYRRRLSVADAAAAIGHAVARQRVGPARFDLAARLWTFPWTILLAVIRRIAGAFSWVPASGLAWHLRIVVGVVALVQGFQPGGEPAIGIGAAVLAAVSYIAPAAERAWRALVEADADRLVACGGLAEPLVGLLAKGLNGSASPQRVHRIRQAAGEANKPATGQDPATPAAPGRNGRGLVHPTALRRCRTITALPVPPREAPLKELERICYAAARSLLRAPPVDPVADNLGAGRARGTGIVTAGRARKPAPQSMHPTTRAASDPCVGSLPSPV